MTQLQMFIPLTKIDAGKRLVYGVVTAETPDRGNEVCDYASTKPYYQKWSDEFRQASGGKSLGNLRAMHGKVAAGRVEAIHFNDDDKQIEVCAKIIDDAEWAKVEAGVYTGFSQGGGYVNRWPDEKNPDLMRYTASPCEISLVDLPCLPSATFAMIKADGAVETMKFASFDNAVEQVWMAGDGKTFKKKAEALAHQALLASSASMLGALERMENDLGKAAPRPMTQALERLRQFYPAQDQANISALLARCLNAIVCQRLIPSAFGKRIPCLEIMKRNTGIQDCIARNDMLLLAGHIEAAVNEGMHSFDQYLMQLLQSKYVTEDTARRYANNWSKVEMEMHGFIPSSSGILKPE